MSKAFALGGALFLLMGCSAGGPQEALYGPSCQPFDPDATNSCLIGYARWSEITELPEPPGMYRYCAWPGLLSGAYKTRYRDTEGAIHELTGAPAQTPSFLLQTRAGMVTVRYRMMPAARPCPDAPP